MVAYFTSASFKRLAPASRLSYAMDLKVFFSFLERQGASWRDATHDSLLDYEYWRRRDTDNLQRVSGAKFARELAACGRFYKWQVDHGVIEASPVLTTTYRDRRGDVATRAQLQPTNVRSVKVKWLTPRAYRRWRDVGLGGYNGDGLLDSSWRGRNDDRNVSMSELMWSSGLRLREAGSVLLTELPTAQSADQYVRGHVAEAVAKGRGRDFWVSRSALRRIDAYVMTTRAAAVRRAQVSGRYDEIAERRLVTQMNARGDLIMEDRRGRSERTNINEMDSEIRRCLFQQTDDGVEPLSLWLTEAGTPMPYLTWEAVFAGASSRCAAQGVPITCHPHMLRHSFALRMLVTLIHNFDRRLGLSERERLEYRHLFGDPWVLVQRLLGHSNLVTTKSYYLEPVQGLQVDMFLNADTDDESVQQLLTRISEMSPLVQDLEGPA
ncbi:Phage integrase, N-terminal SAM-like domain [Ferrithrix thermotolerans DSM 19514]|uniref:Phage integrase, N-terminal SAM-like domain n=1 Tax=Ferrithrix thermotolerans DSM 19514 TaxID=1121881 RepID=A0A1M4WD44_9ACTN|nr:Phage integrase, N-terminal SAM-like domain [Ferrithrix thermotolerans DSM 19514]